MVLSKRKLIRLVSEGYVNSWDDPRMPTLSGMRRRGFTATAIRSFLDHIGVAKSDSVVDVALLEHFIRQELNATSPRVMAVLRPLKLVIVNYPEDQVEFISAINNPEDLEMGTREVPFSRELYIERDDFMEDPPKKFFRLAPGREVRLRYAYFVTCVNVIKDGSGEIIEIHCTYDPETQGGDAPDGRKVRATLHWVSANHAMSAEVRLFDRLFGTEYPEEVEEGQDFTVNINPDSMEIIESAYLEPGLNTSPAGTRYQFERLGYFVVDPDTSPEKPVFNRTLPLRDTWARLQKKQK